MTSQASFSTPHWPQDGHQPIAHVTTPTPTIVFPESPFHYDILSSDSIKQYLDLVVESLVTHDNLHDWDDQFAPDPVRKLAIFAKAEMARSGLDKADHMVNFNLIREVIRAGGSDVSQTLPMAVSDTVRQLFPRLHERTIDENGGGLSHGRIVEIKEQINYLRRATLLMIQAFCLRLLDEDFTFVRNFVQRHLMLEHLFKEPYILQETSPSNEQDAKCYKRLTLSFHLPHLLLGTSHFSGGDSEIIDRDSIEVVDTQVDFEDPDSPSGSNPRLFKAASSVLLTLVLPEEQPSREEAYGLLSNPQCLWTVLIVNGSWRLATGSLRNPSNTQTPLSQFLRGVVSAITAQRQNLRPILASLKTRLAAADNGTLFDDRRFGKSRTYHALIATCHRLAATIDASLAFLREFRADRLPALAARAQASEAPGLDHWRARLREEIGELERARLEVNAFREQVRELRDALHGATALLESRIAVMQGDRIKTLTYLSVAYLPLSLITSVYSISVLPASADLASYFVTMAVALVVTVFVTVVLLRSEMNRQELDFAVGRPPEKRVISPLKAPRPGASNISRRLFLLPLFFLSVLLWRLFRLSWKALMHGTVYLLWTFPEEELSYASGLLYRPVPSVVFPRHFSVRKMVWDLLRFFALPVWLLLVLTRAGIRLCGRCVVRCWCWRR
ncbi:Uu.00g047390.m01.CDS01 [Anthostomella pinea]|uniref:Uu.00g047390.m01.CDS01 n=1 Tax=Anthostomella pinea TaxID=933095 RepID=A0AAI8YEH9_9PEZI|nr:Uu.00g047390.m01.CDS01 [Anthostomella pinea]